jgi:hypothetical protein
VERKIFIIRKKRVMLDHDLAGLYGVPTKALNQAVKRNSRRFPEDYMFQLDPAERKELVTNCDRFKILKHSSSLPFAFTELGVAMLSSVLNSEQAIAINMHIMRVFTKVKEAGLAHQDLTLKINELEKKYDKQFQVVFKAIKMLLDDKPGKDKDPRRFGW